MQIILGGESTYAINFEDYVKILKDFDVFPKQVNKLNLYNIFTYLTSHRESKPSSPNSPIKHPSIDFESFLISISIIALVTTNGITEENSCLNFHRIFELLWIISGSKSIINNNENIVSKLKNTLSSFKVIFSEYFGENNEFDLYMKNDEA